jgi:hypothetical protein
VVGVNYYWNSQWEHGTEGEWFDEDDRRRVRLRELADDVEGLFDANVPLRGVCIYPIIGMFDWHRPRSWMQMGLWDCDSLRGMRRLPHRPMLDALAHVQERLGRNRLAA